MKRLLHKIKEKFNCVAMQLKLHKTALCFINFIDGCLRKVGAFFIGQWQKYDPYNRVVLRFASKVKQIFLTVKKNYYRTKTFYNVELEKKVEYQLRIKHVLQQERRAVLNAIVRVIKKLKENKRLANPIKKISAQFIKTWSYLKASTSESLRETHERFSKYEWYVQLCEATNTDIVKITLLSCFFINLLALAFPLSLMQVYNRIIPNQAYETLTVLAIGIAIAILLEMVLRIARTYINLWGDAKYEYALSKKAFLNLLHVPLYVYEDTDIGTRIKQFAVLDQMRGFYNQQLLVSICDIPFLVVFLLVIYDVGHFLVLVPIFIALVLFFKSFGFIDKWRYSLERKITQESRENDFLVNVLGNIHTAKSFGIENLLIRRYERMQHTTNTVNFDSTVQQGDLDTLKSSVSQFATVLMASIGGFAVMTGGISTGSLIACILLSGRFVAPLVTAISVFNRWKMINIIRSQLDVILHTPVVNEIEQVDVKGEITLKNLSYLSKTEIGTHWAFRNINIHIEPLTVVSIIGDTHGNKEKLLNILAAVSRPTTGEYLIDGKSIDKLQNYMLRNKISYLSKSGSLFHGSIMDNLSGFNPDLIPVAERFAQKLGLDSVIAKLPSGYETLVGNKAVEALPLSVMNLIYIIRALVNKPKIILFDEADMNLDVQATNKMIKLLTILKEIATIVILPVSEEAIAFSDVVYELKDGELKKVIVDDSAHDTK